MRLGVNRVVVVAVAFFLGLQVVPVDRKNPPVDPSQSIYATERLPAKVAMTLRRSCHNCHSDQTRWPWYSYVAPVSWMVAHDVHAARRQMNLSEWAGYSERKREEKLNGICEQVVNGDMPEGKYAFLHRRARVAEDERAAICEWVEEARR
jgi:Haem-binding domain